MIEKRRIKTHDQQHIEAVMLQCRCKNNSDIKKIKFQNKAPQNRYRDTIYISNVGQVKGVPMDVWRQCKVLVNAFGIGKCCPSMMNG